MGDRGPPRLLTRPKTVGSCRDLISPSSRLTVPLASLADAALQVQEPGRMCATARLSWERGHCASLDPSLGRVVVEPDHSGASKCPQVPGRWSRRLVRLQAPLLDAQSCACKLRVRVAGSQTVRQRVPSWVPRQTEGCACGSWADPTDGPRGRTMHELRDVTDACAAALTVRDEGDICRKATVHRECGYTQGSTDHRRRR